MRFTLCGVLHAFLSPSRSKSEVPTPDTSGLGCTSDRDRAKRKDNCGDSMQLKIPVLRCCLQEYQAACEMQLEDIDVGNTIPVSAGTTVSKSTLKTWMEGFEADRIKSLKDTKLLTADNQLPTNGASKASRLGAWLADFEAKR
ncbi:hypothetical protein CCR75_002857 [Bremia lactucae]|uniref:Uncharacterized protein n=1 Tax=Bremia lactucae TaxID=4779 RepID=A0A976FMG3_BRELC|nr:hypothetical protein CCR75_002857 [Bremia lactucae]